MKIAFVSDIIYPYSKGGKETRSYDLAKQLAKRGNEVHFYTMKSWEGEDIIKKQGFYLHGICKPLPLYVNGRRNISQGIKFGIASFKLLKEDFDVLDADHMVYFHLWPCKLACLIKRKKFIVTWHEVWGKAYWKKYLGKKGIFGYLIEKWASKLPNKIISVSEHTTKNLIDNLKVNPEKIITIPNAIEFNKIQKIKPSRESSDVIFAGRLLSHKNVDILIKSIAIIKQQSNPKVKCIILGDGPEMNNLKSLTKQLNLQKNIFFKGFLDKSEDVLALMKSSKVFVLPSEREGFGISVIEANACGIPVITVNHKDNASKSLIQDNRNGFVCELNEESLAENIIKSLKKNKEDWKAECKVMAKVYDWPNIIKMFEGVYE